MNETLKQELISFLDVVREHPLIDVRAKTQVVVDWYEKEINCLEAKPKALNSIQEAKEDFYCVTALHIGNDRCTRQCNYCYIGAEKSD